MTQITSRAHESVVYFAAMDSPMFANITRYLRIAVLLWCGYLVCVMILDVLLILPHGTIPWFAVVNLVFALMALGLVSWQSAQQRLGRAFFPLVIVLLSVLPTIVSFLLVPLIPRMLLTPAEGILLRLLPIYFLCLILIAWQYQWRQVLLYSAAVALLNLGALWLLRIPTLTPNSGLVFILTITVIMFVLGYFISFLMTRLRAQQASFERANAQLANYASTLEHLAVSRERNRVARELHDTLAHTLTGMTVQLETMKAYWDVDPNATHQLLDQVLDASRNGVQETRRALKALRASPLDDLGLALAIRQLAESAAERAHLGLEISVSETLPNLTPEIEQSIYRIAQEAIENAVHHANAKHVQVKLAARENNLVLEIHDDGKGFDTTNHAPQGHYGLAGMQERAALIGGTLEISSQVGKGTRIMLTV